jgi:hypothetical protein
LGQEAVAVVPVQPQQAQPTKLVQAVVQVGAITNKLFPLVQPRQLRQSNCNKAATEALAALREEMQELMALLHQSATPLN